MKRKRKDSWVFFFFEFARSKRVPGETKACASRPALYVYGPGLHRFIRCQRNFISCRSGHELFYGVIKFIFVSDWLTQFGLKPIQI